jgi:hypothetical protein
MLMLRIISFLFALTLITTLRLSGDTLGTVRGVISDQSGGVIAGASVGLYSAVRDWETRSDSAGNFYFAGVTPGTYEIEASSPGFVTRNIENLRVDRNDPQPISITLNVGACPPGCDWANETCYPPRLTYVTAQGKQLLTGFVLSSRIVPLANSTLSLLKAREGPTLVSGQTGARGEFQFKDLEPGRYFLRASHGGHIDHVTPLRIRPGKITQAKIYLEDQTVHRGAVITACP